MPTVDPDLLAAYKGALSSMAQSPSSPSSSGGSWMGPAAAPVSAPSRFIPAPEQLDSGGLVSKFLAGASPEIHAGLAAFHGQTPPMPADPADHLTQPPVTPKQPTIEPPTPVTDAAPAVNAAAGLASAIPEAGDFHAAQASRIRQAIFG